VVKRIGDTRIAGRAQGARPDAVPEAHKHIAAERSLVGALAVPIEQIIPDPAQPRQGRNQASLDELAASIKEYGVLQPLLVREHGVLDDGRTQYMIVVGGRRYVAAQQAGLARLPVVVRESEGATLRMTQLVENVQRQDLAPLEEARAFKELMDAEGFSAEELGKRLHVSGQKVRDRLVLLSNPKVSDAVQRGQIGPTVARDVLRLADEPQAALLARIDAGASVDTTDVNEARARAVTAGVANPRRTGGGRPSRISPLADSPAAVTPPPPPASKIQTSFEHPSPIASLVPPVDSLKAALGALDVGAVVTLLQYGVDAQWTCEQLLGAIEAVSAGDNR